MKRAILSLYILCLIIFSGYSQTVSQAHQAIETVIEKGTFVEEITPENIKSFPIGIHKTVGNIPVTLAVNNVVFDESYTEIDVFVKMELPEQVTLFFGAEKLKFSYEGDFIGNARLALLEDVNFPAFSDNSLSITLKGGNDKLVSKDISYVNITCSGVEDFGLAVDLIFSEQFLKPVDSNGDIIVGEKLVTSFKTQVADFEDIIVGVNLPAFAVNGLDGYSFACENMVFDFSQIRNDATVSYPTNYAENYIGNTDHNLWKGFYAEKISVTVPACFKEKDNNKKLSFSANHLIIDEFGLSGLFTASGPLLSYEKGTASGWDFSVESFSLELEANALKSSSFTGNIGLPIGETGVNKLGYTGFFDVYNNYYLSVDVENDLDFNVLSATASIKKESYVKLQVLDGQFRPEALLHGNLNFNVSSKSNTTPKDTTDSAIKMNGIEFQSMKLQTVVPYFSAEYFGYKGSAAISGIPISISELGLSSTNTNLDFTCGVGIVLGNIVSAETNLTIRGNNEFIDNRLKWKYDKFILNYLSVDATIAEVFSLKGQVNMYDNDPTYGNGFGGELYLGFHKVLEGLNINARASFGKKDDFEYWMTDARVEFPGGIPCGPITLNGFSGGASSKMKRLAANDGTLTDTYIPDKNYGFGLKAGVIASFASEDLVKAEVIFEILFNKHGGLNLIALYGNADFLKSVKTDKLGKLGTLKEKASGLMDNITKIEEDITKGNSKLLENLSSDKVRNPQKTCSKLAESDEAVIGMKANIVMQYDFTNDSFHAQLEMAVNVADILYGSGPNYSAGKAVLHIDAKEWYLHVGTPSNPIALALGIENLASVNASAYFMAGHNIPNAPNPPRQVADILGTDLASLDYMRDFNALNSGKGMAFGSQLNIDTGDLYFLIVYARFQAGVGFDLMLKDYEEAQCRGRSGAVGINGWYANGQSYAYLAGELGVGINLFFIQTKVPIISGGTATILQGMLPNPTWLQGQLAVNFDLLGGLVKGNIGFKFELGEKCDLLRPGQSPLDSDVIADLQPNNSSSVDVFVVPQVAFNIPIGKSFSFKQDKETIPMRIALKNLTLTDAENKTVQGTLKWSDEKDKVSYYTEDVLMPQTTYTFNVTVSFEEFKEGKWNIVKTSGKESTENRSLTFTTGDAPRSIPLHNINYMYPIKDQQCFYRSESSDGFVKLKQGQDYLFVDTCKYVVEFIDKSNNKIVQSSLTYNKGENILQFSFPNGLRNKTDYNISFKAIVSKEDNIIKAANYRSISDIKVKENKADELSNEGDIIILSYDFRSSKYNKFSEKLDAINLEKPWYEKINSTVYALGYSMINISEPFDIVEVIGNEYTDNNPVVTLVATGADDYYKSKISPLYNQSFISLNGARNDNFGRPPFKAILTNKYYVDDLQNGIYNYDRDVFPWLYETHVYYLKDWNYARAKLIDKQCSGKILTTQEQVLRGHFPLLPKGKYPVAVNYVLPNGKVSSSTTFYFKNEF